MSLVTENVAGLEIPMHYPPVEALKRRGNVDQDADGFSLIKSRACSVQVILQRQFRLWHDQHPISVSLSGLDDWNNVCCTSEVAT